LQFHPSPAPVRLAAAAAAGVSLQANTQALMSLAGFAASDVLLLLQLCHCRPTRRR
jgi:hypothetical protein